MRRIDLDDAEIARLYAVEGLRADEIAKLMGCTTAAVYERLQLAGVQRSREARLPMDEVIRLYVDEGWSLYRLGELYHVAPQTVGKHLRKRGVLTRNHKESHRPTGLAKAPGTQEARAYLLGLVWGDFAVERHGAGDSLIHLRSSTTRREQVEMARDVFGALGSLRIAESKGVTAIRVTLDSSFAFLLEKYDERVEQWIATGTAQSAFAAGYIDAEGSFGVYEGRARFKVASYDAQVLMWMDEWLDSIGIRSRLRMLGSKGSVRSNGKLLASDLWCLNVNEASSLVRLAATIRPFLFHPGRRRALDLVVENVESRFRALVGH